MHSIVFVLLPPDTSDIQVKTESLLAAFNSELELAPYKRRYGSEQVEYWKKRFGKNELPALAEELSRQIKSDFGTDEDGLFEISTFNESGRWDGWSPFNYFERDPAQLSRWGKKLARSIRPATLLSEKDFDAPYSLITPDGKWHSVEDFGYNLGLQVQCEINGLHPENTEPVARWGDFVRSMVMRHADHLVFVLDCHS